MKKSLLRLDLNLLLTLQLLCQERSVSKVAKQLNLTPSSVSKSLAKLRDWFDDPLFIRTPTGLVPTPLVEALSEDLQQWLLLGGQIAESSSEESGQEIEFHLAIESPLVLTMLNQLNSEIFQRYPSARVVTSQWDYDSIDSIIKGEVDVGFSGRESHPRSRESLQQLPYYIDYQVLFSDMPRVFMRRDHPAVLSKRWDLEVFLHYAHINVRWEKSDTWALDEILRDLGRKRSIALTVANFEQALFMAAEPGHEMLTTAPGYCSRYLERLSLDLVSMPIPLPNSEAEKLMVPFTLMWHKRNAYNPKVQWLRERFAALFETCDG
ncbi:HTH-type transcriptional regulator YidZ [Vibrio sp. WXL210]|uniref:HTH-type transcriptional regulator YidZ n=1 Tax=Vibrio sp. WXL210 TaxID=3450709 RepID=UPI003EC81F0A